jgi:hypothetical protein
MAAFKVPDFKDRAAAAALAKEAALAKLRDKPPVDEAAIAARAAKDAERTAAAAAKREAARVAKEEAIVAKRKRAEEEVARAAAAAPKVMTEAERKAIRDAKYAARKNRKS